MHLPVSGMPLFELQACITNVILTRYFLKLSNVMEVLRTLSGVLNRALCLSLWGARAALELRQTKRFDFQLGRA